MRCGTGQDRRTARRGFSCILVPPTLCPILNRLPPRLSRPICREQQRKGRFCAPRRPKRAPGSFAARRVRCGRIGPEPCCGRWGRTVHGDGGDAALRFVGPVERGAGRARRLLGQFGGVEAVVTAPVEALGVCFNLSLGLRATLTGCKSPLHSTGSPTTGLVQGAIFASSILALAIRPKIKTDSYRS